MSPLHTSAGVKKIAKSIVPTLSFLTTAFGLQGFARYTEIGAALLQGKGAGSGWDLSAEVRAAAASIARTDPVLLDVGANYGKWSLGMLELFPNAQKIVMFEPQQECFEHLSQWDFTRKVIVRSAVSNKPGNQSFHVAAAGWGAASLYQRTETFFSTIPQREITVPVTTIDSVVEDEQIEFVDFAKFDIEGAELAAFEGASRTFARRGIGALSLEFGSGNINSRTFFRDFWDLLTGYGFEIFRVLPSGRLFRVREYYEDMEYFRGVSNYIARLAGHLRRF